MPAEDLILQCVRDNPDLVILAMGAMTNLAMAFLREPELMRHVKILAMGGAFFDAKPEWNIACDPEAARLVMEQSENLIMMGLDVTKYLRISPEMLDPAGENERSGYGLLSGGCFPFSENHRFSPSPSMMCF